MVQVVQKGCADPPVKTSVTNGVYQPNLAPDHCMAKPIQPLSRKILKYLRVIWRDLTNKEYIPLKIVFFFLLGAGVSLLQYNVVHMKALGLDVEEIGIVFMLLPVIGLLSTPLIGLIADKLGNFKHFMTMTTLCLGIVGMLYLTVPVARELVYLPEKIIVLLLCQNQTEVYYTQQFERPCQWAGGDLTVSLLDIQCGMMCVGNLSIYHNQSSNSIDFLNQSISESDRLLRLRSDTTLLLHPLEPSTQCDPRLCNNNSLYLSSPNISSNNQDEFYVPPVTWGVTNTTDGILNTLTCQNDNVDDDCQRACWTAVPRQAVCDNESAFIPRNVRASFWIYLLIRAIQAAIVGGSYSLFEGAVIIILKKSQGDFGLQRVWSSVGAMITAPIVGIIVDEVQKARHNKLDYSPMFYIYFGLHVVCAIFIQQLNLDTRRASNNLVADLRKLLSDIVVISFLVAMFMAGIFWGYIESFLFWYLEEMNAPKFLMGLTLTAGTLAGLPFMMTAGPIIRRIGHVNVLIIGFAAFAVRLFGYSIITNPWHALIFEALESLTSSLMMTAAVTFAGILATEGTITTLQGLYGGLHYGLGRGCGSIVGGTLMKHYGVRATFMYLGIVCSGAMVVYLLVHHLFLKHHSKEVDRRIEEDNAKEETIVAVPPLPGVYENAAYQKDVLPASCITDLDDDIICPKVSCRL